MQGTKVARNAGTSPVKVWELILRELRQNGAEELFGVLGAGNLAFVGVATSEFGMNYHSLRHEASAVAAADAYARVSGRLGVATVTHGPGLTHAASAIVEAVKSDVPMLLVTSAVDHGAPHQNQSLDQAALVTALGASAFAVARPEEAAAVVRAAVETAVSGSPAILIVPGAVQHEDIPEAARHEGIAAEALSDTDAALSFTSTAKSDLDSAVSLLEAARRPVILAGRGAESDPTIERLREIGRRVGALLFTTLPAKDAFVGDPFNAGICGSFGDPEVVALAGQADVALVVGSSLSSWTTVRGTVFPETKIVRLDHDRAVSRTNGSAVVVGDATESVRELLAALRPHDREGYRTPEVRRFLASTRARLDDDRSDETGMDPRRLVHALDGILPPARTVVVDGGHFSGWPAIHLRTPRPGSFVYAHGYQCVGLSLGNVVGAAVGAAGTFPIAFIGDGGLLMSAGELDAIIGLAMPVLVVVMNDGGYGAEFHQATRRDAELTLLPENDYAALARAFGATGISVRSLEDLDELERWLAAPAGLCVVDCRITRAVRAEWLGAA